MHFNYFMKSAGIATFAGAFLAALGGCSSTPPRQGAEQYIIESERAWAESVTTGETATSARILAEDFVGIDPEGKFYDKAAVLAHIGEAPRHFRSNRLDQVKVRFFGDAAVAQGIESWISRDGEPKRGRFVWTDTWVQRNGRWQIVAAEDLIVPENSKP
jgi:ketosteroid isomerase-like protein